MRPQRSRGSDLTEPVPRRYVIHYFRAPEYRTRVWRRTPSGHSRFAVLVAGSLLAEWSSGGRRHELTAKAGDVLYFGPGEGHWETNGESPRLTALNLGVDWSPPGPALPVLAHDERGLIRLLSGELMAIDLTHEPSALKRQLLNGYFLALVAEYRRLTAVRPHPMLEKLRVFTEERITQRFPVTDLARHFGLGKRHFDRQFKAATGRTPMAEVGWVRAEHARNILRNVPGLALKEVARRVGLRDHHQLGRLFRRHFGVRARDLARLTPAALRRAATDRGSCPSRGRA